MYSPKTIYTRIALDSIVEFLKGGNIDRLSLENVPKELFKIRRGCFVSLHLQNDDLRGCIGTIESVEENLYNEIIRNAIASVSRDSRFEPVVMEELDEINISVDVLSEPQKILAFSDLDPTNYGLIVSDGKYSKGILLPDLESVTTVEQQISIVKKKAGLQNYNNDSLKFYRFTSKRYY